MLGSRIIELWVKEDGKEGEELLARAICHELAHLDGHLYTELVEGELVDTEAEEDNKKNKKYRK